ncbi:MAG: Bax inhibitor-1/YccA family protein [Flavobacteriales bacterium]
MEERNQYQHVLDSSANTNTSVKSFMTSVFSYMFLGLIITGFVAYYFATQGLIKEYLVNPQTGGPNTLFYISAFAPLGFVFIMGLGFKRLSAASMMLLFLAFALLNGVAFSSIFVTYQMGTISTAFFSASSIFAIMAVVGYTTTTDLTKLGSLLYIGLIGIIIAMIINWFAGSEMISYVISVIGVVIFTGLTAYDVQKLKRIGEGTEIGTASTKKLAVYGALSLYLDFINLFLFLLRILGGRD